MINDVNNKYLIFEVDEEYALGVRYIVEIIENTDITRVPEAPDYIAGIINLHGMVVPVIDIRKRFKKPPKVDAPRRCIIITKVESNPLGLIVDNVVDMIDMEPDKLKEPPQVGGSYVHVFIKAIGIYEDRMHLVVDPDKLVNYNDLFFTETAEPEETEETAE